MDHFEQELKRMLRANHDGGDDAGDEMPSYDDHRRRRLHAAVRARQRTRRAWMATGSALTTAALGAVLTTLPNSFAQDGPTTPTTPSPRPTVSAPRLPAPATALPASTTQGEPPLPYRLTTTAKPTT